MKYFGTDGIRGIYGETLTEELAFSAGLAAARFMGGDCFVGMDTRVSGEALLHAVTEGLIMGGCNVKNVGVVPTPAISFLAAKYGCGGIMVSASHNPPEYNGLKFFSPGGYKFTSRLESEVEKYIDSPPSKESGGRKENYKSGSEEYIEWITRGIDLSGKEFALDCAYGAACAVAGEAFIRCGAKVKLLASSYDGSRINCGVGALHPEFIQNADCESGFAFDGDGDRLVAKSGEILDGDSLLFNLALLCKPSGVVGTIMNNMALETNLRRRGIEFVRTAVGDKNISEAMRLHNFTLGGEQSGHYIISPSVSGDALYAAMKLSQAERFIRLELVPQRAASIEAEPSVMFCPKFVKAKEGCEKRLIGKGRLVVRMSGTEPKIRLMAECKDDKLLGEIITILSETINLCNKETL